MLVREAVFVNEASPMLITLAGIVMLVSDLEDANADCPIV
jgi:hypothetical protein